MTICPQAIFDMIDSDGSGYIDFVEFMMARSANRTSGAEAKLGWMFNLFDRDSSGAVEAAEVKDVLVK
jgi:Ca2+-binding EF-hand superfamily protein